MILTIFGATGMVGKELVNQALLNGDEVRAYGRNVFTAGFREDKNLKLITGALFDDGDLYKAIKGCDVVLSTIGGSMDGANNTRSLGMKKIVAQMEKAKVQRLIAVGGMGLLDGPNEKMLFEDPEFPQEFLPVTWEHEKALKAMQASSLGWTMVCPPQINEGDATGIFSTKANEMPEGNYNIKSGDLALFMLDQVNETNFLQQRVGISN